MGTLYVAGSSPLHRLPPQCKVAAAVLFTLAVVSTPREAVWAYGAFALLLVAVAAVSGVPFVVLGRRLLIEVPFVLFALFLPLVGEAPRVDVGGVSLSVPGLWGAWGILAKGTLGVAASVLLASTTPVPALLGGLDRLRVPRAFTTIAGFMVRYADVVSGELRRMGVARASRGGEVSSIRQWRVLATSAGALFIRAYERGERVHLAMLSRGYTGTMPELDGAAATARQWSVALALPLAAATVMLAGWWWPR